MNIEELSRSRRFRLRLVKWAIRHSLAPLLHQRLKQHGLLERWPAKLVEMLDTAYAETQIRNRLLLSTLLEDIRLLDQHGIACIPLKGSHLATCIYEDPAVRPMLDIDILVRTRDSGTAERLLLQAHTDGSQRSQQRDDAHHHLPVIADARGIYIEIHTHLHRSDCSLELDVEQVWARSQPTYDQGHAFRVLSPEDLLIHLSIHTAVNHRFQQSLRWLVDMEAVLRHFAETVDWELLVRITLEARAAEPVYLCLRMCRYIMRVPVPRQVFEALLPAGTREITDAELCRVHLHRASRVVPAGMVRDPRRALRTLLPARAVIERSYGLEPGSRYAIPLYLWRPLHIIAKRTAARVRELAGGAGAVREQEDLLFPLLRWLAAPAPDTVPVYSARANNASE